MRKASDRRTCPEWRFPVAIYLLALCGIWCFMVLVRRFYSGDLSPDPVFRPYLGAAIESRPWLEVWQRWDSLHYQAIAERRYSSSRAALFVPMLYPLLIRAVMPLANQSSLLAGLVVSNTCGLFGVVAFYQLVAHEYEDRAIARRAVLYLVSFPAAFFLFAAYTESLFFLGAVLFLLNLRQEKWLVAGLWGGVAAMARIPGAALVIPSACTAWAVWRKSRQVRPWITPGLISTASALLPLYAWLGLGLSPLEPLRVQTHRFHGSMTWPGLNTLLAARQVWLGIHPLTNILDLSFTLLFVAGTILVLRRLPRPYGVYSVAFIALYLTRVSAVYPLLSMSRYVLSVFPVFIVVAELGEAAWVNRLTLYLSWTGLFYFAGQFAIWGWVG